MKNTLLLGLLLCSSTVLADPDQFKISITNSGAENCILKENNILFGYVSDGTVIPKIIHPDETETFMMKSGSATVFKDWIIIRASDNKDKIILLTYSCGDNKEITLFTDKGNFNLSQKVGGRVLDAQIINAKYTTRLPKWMSHEHNDYPEIHWTLIY